jgi:hypothetical protein
MCGNIRICFKECRLNKKLVGAARKRDDSANILLVIGGVDHVSDLLPTGCAQGVLFEQAEGEGEVAADGNLAVVGCALAHGSLGFVKPCPRQCGAS